MYMQLLPFTIHNRRVVFHLLPQNMLLLHELDSHLDYTRSLLNGTSMPNTEFVSIPSAAVHQRYEMKYLPLNVGLNLTFLTSWPLTDTMHICPPGDCQCLKFEVFSMWYIL